MPPIHEHTRPFTTLWQPRGRPDLGADGDLIHHNVAELARLEQRDRELLTRSDRVADWFTAFSGSMVFVYLHAVWFGLWIAVNLGWLGVKPFDPFPFGLLTLIVSLEAIFLSTFVLISQNRQAVAADRRQKVDMQVNVLAEQEVTSLMRMVAAIHDHLGIEHHDPELQQLQEPTRIDRVVDAIDAAEQPEPDAGGAAHGDDASKS
jgi:uncharacterized membrane protein